MCVWWLLLVVFLSVQRHLCLSLLLMVFLSVQRHVCLMSPAAGLSLCWPSSVFKSPAAGLSHCCTPSVSEVSCWVFLSVERHLCLSLPLLVFLTAVCHLCLRSPAGSFSLLNAICVWSLLLSWLTADASLCKLSLQPVFVALPGNSKIAFSFLELAEQPALGMSTPSVLATWPARCSWAGHKVDSALGSLPLLRTSSFDTVLPMMPRTEHIQCWGRFNRAVITPFTPS